MSEIIGQPSKWKTQTYAIGTISGAVFGLLVAYLFARASEEEIGHGGKRPKIPTTTLIGVTLSALALARQITEAGRPKK